MLALVDAVVFAAAQCFQKRPPGLLPATLAARARRRAGGRLTFRELAVLADESRCCKYRARGPAHPCPASAFSSVSNGIGL